MNKTQTPESPRKRLAMERLAQLRALGLPFKVSLNSALERERDELLELLAIDAWPDYDPVQLQRQCADAQQKLRDFHTKLAALRLGSIQARGRSIETVIQEQIRQANPALPLEELAKPLPALAPHLKKFDWRSLNVVPFVRKQGGGFCWAYAAAAAFESSLMIQRANYAVEVSTVGLDTRGQFSLKRLEVSRKSLVDCADPGPGGSDSAGGRYQKAFNHLVTQGCPVEVRDAPLAGQGVEPEFAKKGRCMPNEASGLKAVAWDYVHERPAEVPPALKLKEALLEHGPLVVALSVDIAFIAYGDPGDVADVFFREKASTGYSHFALLIGWDDNKDGHEVWIIQNFWGKDWGYSCDGAAVMGAHPHATERGYMYIRRDSSNIGQYAAWIEAPLYIADGRLEPLVVN